MTTDVEENEVKTTEDKTAAKCSTWDTVNTLRNFSDDGWSRWDEDSMLSWLWWYKYKSYNCIYAFFSCYSLNAVFSILAFNCLWSLLSFNCIFCILSMVSYNLCRKTLDKISRIFCMYSHCFSKANS